MNAQLRIIAAIAVAASVAIQAGEAKAQEAPQDLKEAQRALFVEALKAMGQKDWATCRLKGLGAYAHEAHNQIAAMLGVCEENLGMYAESAEHLAFARENDDKKSPQRTADVEAAWSRVKQKVGVVEIQTTNQEVEVVRDGRVIGVTPKTLYLEPGAVQVELRKAGFLSRTETINAVAGKQQTISLALEPTTGTEPGPGASSIPRWPGWIFVGIAAAGVGVGGGLLGARASSDGEIDDLVAANPRCNEANPTGGCADVDDLAGERNAFLGGSIAGFAVGGAALIGAIVFFAVGEDAPSKDEAAYLVPMIGPDTAGFIGGFAF